MPPVQWDHDERHSHMEVSEVQTSPREQGAQWSVGSSGAAPGLARLWLWLDGGEVLRPWKDLVRLRAPPTSPPTPLARPSASMRQSAELGVSRDSGDATGGRSGELAERVGDPSTLAEHVVDGDSDSDSRRGDSGGDGNRKEAGARDVGDSCPSWRPRVVRPRRGRFIGEARPRLGDATARPNLSRAGAPLSTADLSRGTAQRSLSAASMTAWDREDAGVVCTGDGASLEFRTPGNSRERGRCIGERAAGEGEGSMLAGRLRRGVVGAGEANGCSKSLATVRRLDASTTRQDLMNSCASDESVSGISGIPPRLRRKRVVSG
mmetsp:Transcript_8318/g.19152  ORF Transcript_8318/g.19152 Transcript_8318/m.19152 type:complete len:321 (+) Transcript_8318:347-1309(+)